MAVGFAHLTLAIDSKVSASPANREGYQLANFFASEAENPALGTTTGSANYSLISSFSPKDLPASGPFALGVPSRPMSGSRLDDSHSAFYQDSDSYAAAARDKGSNHVLLIGGTCVALLAFRKFRRVRPA